MKVLVGKKAKAKKTTERPLEDRQELENIIRKVDALV